MTTPANRVIEATINSIGSMAILVELLEGR